MAGKCELVVCELLCFIFNNLHTSPFDDIVKSCASFYSCKEIVAAKDLVFNSANHPKKRNIARKTASVTKEVADTSDIVQLLLDCDAENIKLPTFVAVNLSNLPTISVNEFDIRGVCKKLSSIKDDLSRLADFVYGSKGSTAARSDSAPLISETRVQEMHTEVSTIKQETICVKQSIANLTELVRDKLSYASALSKPNIRAGSINSLASTSVDGATEAITQKLAAACAQDFAAPPLNNSQQFVKVLRPSTSRKLNSRKNGIIGIATDTQADGSAAKVLRATPRTRNFYVGRFELGTEAEDVKGFLKANRPGVTVKSVELLNTEQFGYRAFKIACTNLSDDSLILDPHLWSVGIRCRVFYERRARPQE